MNQTKLTPRSLAKTWNLPLNEMQKLLVHCNIYINNDAYLTKEECARLKKYMSDLKQKQKAKQELELQETTIITPPTDDLEKTIAVKPSTDKTSTQKSTPVPPTKTPDTSNGPIHKVGDLSSQSNSSAKQGHHEDDDSYIPGLNTFIKDNVSSALQRLKKVWKNFSN